MVIDAYAITLRIAVGKQTCLEHLVGRKTDAGHDVGRIERRLLDVGEVVVGIAVELKHSDFDQRVIAVWPDLGQIEGIDRIRAGVDLRHDLHIELPLREEALLDAGVQVALGAFTIIAHQRCGLLVAQVLNALLGLPGELYPEALVGRGDETEGMAAEPVHVAV
ncbi:hypothetical protein D3C87_1171110 [compost metagenome]